MPLQWRNQIWQSLEEGAESDARSVPGDLAVPATHAVRLAPKLQALVYDILPSTTAVFSYAIGSRTKLSANEPFCFCFVCLLVLKL